MYSFNKLFASYISIYKAHTIFIKENIETKETSDLKNNFFFRLHGARLILDIVRYSVSGTFFVSPASLLY